MLWKEKSLSKNNHCSSSPLISIGYLQSITVCSFSWGEMSWTLNMALITSLGGLTACNKDWRTKREREISHRRCRAGVWMKLSFGISVNSDLTNDLRGGRDTQTHRRVLISFKALKTVGPILGHAWLCSRSRSREIHADRTQYVLQPTSPPRRALVRNLLKKNNRYDLQWYDIGGKAARDQSCPLAQRVIFGTYTWCRTAGLPGSLAVHYK